MSNYKIKKAFLVILPIAIILGCSSSTLIEDDINYFNRLNLELNQSEKTSLKYLESIGIHPANCSFEIDIKDTMAYMLEHLDTNFGFTSQTTMLYFVKKRLRKRHSTFTFESKHAADTFFMNFLKRSTALPKSEFSFQNMIENAHSIKSGSIECLLVYYRNESGNISATYSTEVVR